MNEESNYYLAFKLIKQLYDDEQIPRYMFENISKDISDKIEKLENAKLMKGAQENG